MVVGSPPNAIAVDMINNLEIVQNKIGFLEWMTYGLPISLILILPLSGCCMFGATDEALLREIRKDLVESTRPTLVEALDNARGHDGMIDPLRTERVKTVDAMVESVDRVYPPVDEDRSRGTMVEVTNVLGQRQDLGRSQGRS